MEEKRMLTITKTDGIPCSGREKPNGKQWEQPGRILIATHRRSGRFSWLHVGKGVVRMLRTEPLERNESEHQRSRREPECSSCGARKCSRATPAPSLLVFQNSTQAGASWCCGREPLNETQENIIADDVSLREVQRRTEGQQGDPLSYHGYRLLERAVLV